MYGNRLSRIQNHVYVGRRLYFSCNLTQPQARLHHLSERRSLTISRYHTILTDTKFPALSVACLLACFLSCGQNRSFEMVESYRVQK